MLKYLKIHWIGCLYSILLIGFTVYMFMDTFLISKVYRWKRRQKDRILFKRKVDQVKSRRLRKQRLRYRKHRMRMGRFLLL